MIQIQILLLFSELLHQLIQVHIRIHFRILTILFQKVQPINVEQLRHYQALLLLNIHRIYIVLIPILIL